MTIPPPERPRRGLFCFGPEAGIHDWLASDLIALTIAVFLAALYVWVDRPGPSDVGEHTLSGWLVRLFGVQWARLLGTALFVALGFALLGGVIAYGRWLSAPIRARRRKGRPLSKPPARAPAGRSRAG